MSSDLSQSKPIVPAPESEVPDLKPSPYAAPAALMFLVLIEAVILLFPCHLGRLLARQEWWAQLQTNTTPLAWFGCALATAMVVFGFDLIRREWVSCQASGGRPDDARKPGADVPSLALRACGDLSPGPQLPDSSGHQGADAPRSPEASRWGPLSWLFLLLHLAAFVGLTQATNHLVRADDITTFDSQVWTFFWWTLIWLAPVLLGAAALPGWGFRSLLVVTAVGLVSLGIGATMNHLWLPLADGTLWLVQGLWHLLFREPLTHPEGHVLASSSFRADIGPGCSGYEGIGLIWLFLSVYFWIYRSELRFPRVLLLLIPATIVVWLCNAARIAVLIALGTWVSPALALDGFHSQAGWLIFNGIALGLIGVMRYSPYFAVVPATAKDNPTAVFVAPLFVLLAVMITTAAFTTGFEWFYPLRVLAVAGVLWYFRAAYWPPSPSPSPPEGGEGRVRGARLEWNWSWVAVVAGAVVFVLWVLLEPTPSLRDEVRFQKALDSMPRAWAVSWLVFRVVGSVVTVPLAEELAFRGYLTRRLISADFEEVPLGRFTWLSFLVSSALFGVLHGRWLAGFLAGLVYALVLYRRGKLSDCVIAHATTNAMIAVHVLTTGMWSLWY